MNVPVGFVLLSVTAPDMVYPAVPSVTGGVTMTIAAALVPVAVITGFAATLIVNLPLPSFVSQVRADGLVPNVKVTIGCVTAYILPAQAVKAINPPSA